MSKCEMLINCVPGEESRIAIIEDGRLEEIYQERASAQSHVGNIYKGQVVNVEPAIQAAFIDFGLERNGFLHITDLHPKYFPAKVREESERVGHKMARHERPPIQKCLRRGQEVLIQILKEGIGTKGPTVTSYLSIPGRFIVMMPHMERLGVSRKMEDDEMRREMRKLLGELNPPKDFGFIVRTAGEGRTKADLKRDLSYLQRLWVAIDRRRKVAPNTGELYAESDLVIRTIRDVFTSDISRIIVDDDDAAGRARDFLAIANPRSASNVMVYKESVPLFRRFGVEQQIETISSRVVDMPSGGSLVIDQTEALVAIDVNSGKMRDNRDAETTAYKTNVEAADEICRQLRLRDLGGLIIMDLIDMSQAKHRRAIEQQFRQNLKRDRARTRITSISQFGILEMTRQRMRPSLKKSTSIDCPHCLGTGSVKSTESVVLDVMRRLATVLHQPNVARVELTISPDVAFQLLNRKRADVVALEQSHDKTVTVRVNSGGPIDCLGLEALDQRGVAVDTESFGFSHAPVLESPQALDAAELFEQRDEEVGAADGQVDQADSDESSPTSSDSPGSPDSRGSSESRGSPESAGSAGPSEPPVAAKPTRRRRSRRGRRTSSSVAAADSESPQKTVTAQAEPPATSQPRRRRRKRSSAAKAPAPVEAGPAPTADGAGPAPVPSGVGAAPAPGGAAPVTDKSGRGYSNKVLSSADK